MQYTTNTATYTDTKQLARATREAVARFPKRIQEVLIIFWTPGDPATIKHMISFSIQNMCTSRGDFRKGIREAVEKHVGSDLRVEITYIND